jgi:hypothetical protein
MRRQAIAAINTKKAPATSIPSVFQEWHLEAKQCAQIDESFESSCGAKNAGHSLNVQLLANDILTFTSFKTRKIRGF